MHCDRLYDFYGNICKYKNVLYGNKGQIKNFAEAAYRSQAVFPADRNFFTKPLAD